MKEYAQALKTLRKHFGLTQKELAKRLFVSDKTLSKWENGVTQPDISALRAVCENYGITTEQFFEVAAGLPVEEVLATSAPVKPPRSKKWLVILLSAVAVTVCTLVLLIVFWEKFEESIPPLPTNQEESVPPNQIAITYLVDGERYGYEKYEKYSMVNFPEPNKHGCVFEGWYTEEEGGLLYDFKRVQVSATVYARFRPIRYTVVCQDSENESNRYTMSLESGQEWRFPNVFTREGYELVGWSDKFHATYEVDSPGVELWEYDGCTVYLTALWELSENVTPTYYTVYFYMTPGSYGGTGMGNGSQKQYGVEWTLPECTAQRTGYLFVGYKRGEKYYSPGDTFLLDLEDASSSNNESVAFGFEWRPITFYINYESELHETSYREAFKYNGNNYLDSSWSGDVPEEYTLIGWEINGKVYEPHQKIGNLTATHLAEFTAKAIWEFGTTGLYYELMEDGTYRVTSYYRKYSHENVYIPDTHLGKAVTAINVDAFNGCYLTKSVFIGNNVTSIPERVFKGCDKLASITVGENNPAYQDIDGNLYTKDGKTLLQYAVGKTQTSFTLPESVTNIEAEAFDGCGSLTKITIPEGVTVIGAKVFKGCAGLTEITLPESVTVIEAEAFKDCGSLTKINIPDGVTGIGANAFKDCKALTSITVGENNPSYQDIDGNLYTKDGKTLLQYAVGKTQTSFTIPESVTDIGEEAFKGCSSLTEITIHDGVTSIGANAFSDCNGLTSATCSAFAIVHLPRINLLTATITSGDTIAGVTFYSCKKLKKVTLPDGLKGIGGAAFNECLQLTEIVIPNSVTDIGELAFNGCSSLTEINIPEKVISIGFAAFSDCISLTEIFIPEKVISIGSAAFSGCLNLIKITVDENNPAYQDIEGNLYTKNGEILMQYAVGKTETSFTVPKGVTNIGENAFDGCSNLTEIIISESVTVIGSYAFFGCRDLTVFIPDSVVSIASSAFSSAYNVKVYFEVESPPEIWNYLDADLYWYRETEPPLNSSGTAYKGNYWHYGENGEIIVWEYKKSEE